MRDEKNKTSLRTEKIPGKTEIFSVFGFTAQTFEKLAKDIWGNFPEASAGSALQCVGYNYGTWSFSFQDTESEEDPEKIHRTTREKCLGAVATFLVLKIRGQLKGIAISDFHDASEYDAIAADAIAQLAVLGEVIYG